MITGITCKCGREMKPVPGGMACDAYKPGDPAHGMIVATGGAKITINKDAGTIVIGSS